MLVAHDSPRGGLLGQMAFLTMGSNGERSSPIIRGVLVAEKFLHKEIASPPANVPELASASDKPLAVMEIVEMHQRKAQCASCHRKLDPIGFGLENFDLLGRWRDLEVVGNIGKKAGKKSEKIPVRAEGRFPNQREFGNFEEFPGRAAGTEGPARAVDHRGLARLRTRPARGVFRRAGRR